MFNRRWWPIWATNIDWFEFLDRIQKKSTKLAQSFGKELNKKKEKPKYEIAERLSVDYGSFPALDHHYHSQSVILRTRHSEDSPMNQNKTNDRSRKAEFERVERKAALTTIEDSDHMSEPIPAIDHTHTMMHYTCSHGKRSVASYTSTIKKLIQMESHEDLQLQCKENSPQPNFELVRENRLSMAGKRAADLQLEVQDSRRESTKHNTCCCRIGWASHL